MKKTYTVTNRLGFHVMPSKRLATAAGNFACDITLEFKGTQANPRKMIEILKLGIKCSDEVTLITEGADAEQAQAVLGELLSQEH